MSDFTEESIDLLLCLSMLSLYLVSYSFLYLDNLSLEFTDGIISGPQLEPVYTRAEGDEEGFEAEAERSSAEAEGGRAEGGEDQSQSICREDTDECTCETSKGGSEEEQTSSFIELGDEDTKSVADDKQQKPFGSFKNKYKRLFDVL
jgi:hypothetical protein